MALKYNSTNTSYKNDQLFVYLNPFSSLDFNIIENEASGILIFFTEVVDEKVDQIDHILREKLKDCSQFHLLQSGKRWWFLKPKNIFFHWGLVVLVHFV